MNQLPKARMENIVIQELEKEILIYDLKINKAFCLNQTLALVWQLCDGKNSISDLTHLVNRKLKTRVTEELVWLALNELKKNDLLENPDLIINHFAGLSRREAVKKVGLASMVTLPVITSLVAPMAAQAQSLCAGNGGVCVRDQNGGSNCCTNLFCVNSVSEPTSLICQGCIPFGQPCTDIASCCVGVCIPDPFGQVPGLSCREAVETPLCNVDGQIIPCDQVPD